TCADIRWRRPTDRTAACPIAVESPSPDPNCTTDHRQTTPPRAPQQFDHPHSRPDPLPRLSYATPTPLPRVQRPKIETRSCTHSSAVVLVGRAGLDAFRPGGDRRRVEHPIGDASASTVDSSAVKPRRIR